MPNLSRAALEDAMVEVFPDVSPRKEGLESDCPFVVLASSTIHQDGEQRPRYTGVGITVKSTGEERHFYRTGALHFRDLNVQEWECLRSPDVKDCKFWLE